MRNWLVFLVWGVVPLARAEISTNQLAFAVDVYTDQVYFETQGIALKADVYQPQGSTDKPVLLYIHGGGWAYNDRQSAQLRLLPWLQKGFAVVNIDYRKIAQNQAPAAVIDARCALNWIRQQAKRFRFDLHRIVISGNSAGGHLALMTAYTSGQLLFDQPCWDGPGPDVAAVVNWYGITDVADLIAGDNIRAYAVQWIGAAGDPAALARQLSPLTYVSAKSPATLTIHGDKDAIVPYSHALRLHQALISQQVTNQLLTLPGKGHGDFSPDEVESIYQQIWLFLQKQKVMP